MVFIDSTAVESGLVMKTGPIFKEGIKGSLFYRASSNSNTVDGGISPTFPDVYHYNKTDYVIISDMIEDNKYLFINKIAQLPVFGEAEISGGYLQFNVDALNPSGSNYALSKTLIAYKLKDFPTSEGALDISDTADVSAYYNANKVCSDLLVYSSSGTGMQENDPDKDFEINFSTLDGIDEETITVLPDALLTQQNPYLDWDKVESEWMIFRGRPRDSLKKYRVDNPYGSGFVVFLKSKSKTNNKGQTTDYWTPKDGRGLFTSEPIQHKSTLKTSVKYGNTDITNYRGRTHDVGTFNLPEHSMILSTGQSGSFYSTTGSITTATDIEAASHTELAYSRMTQGSEFALTGSSGLHMEAFWSAQDGGVVHTTSTNETAYSNGVDVGQSKKPSHRLTNRITTYPLPRPIQLNSDCVTTATATDHEDSYTWNGRIDVVVKINEMPIHPRFHTANHITSHDQGGAFLAGLERCFAITLSDQIPPQGTSLLGYFGDHCNSMIVKETPVNYTDGFIGVAVIDDGEELVVYPNCDSTKNDLSSGQDWESTWKIHTHTDWMQDSSASTNPEPILVTEDTPSNKGFNVPKGEWLRFSFLFSLRSHNTGRDRVCNMHVTNVNTGKEYGYHPIALGLAETTDPPGNNFGLKSCDGSDWPSHLSLWTSNHKAEVDITGTIKTEHGSTVNTELTKVDDKINTKVDVYVDRISLHGFSSDAENASTVHENAFTKGNIDISTHDIKRSTLTLLSIFGDPGASEYQYHPNRNTIAIGHPTLKGHVGNNDGAFTTNEKAYFILNNYKNTNAFNAAIETDDAATLALQNPFNILTDLINTPVFRVGYNSDEIYGGKQIGFLALDTYKLIEGTDYRFYGSAGFCDGFSQPGGFWLDWDMQVSKTFTKREHILSSARILKIITGKSFIVDKPHLLKINNAEEGSGLDYRIYNYNTDQTNASNYRDVKVISIDESTGIVKVDTSVSNSPISVTDPGSWLISPKAWWVTFHFFNTDASDNDLSNKSFSSIWGFLSDESGDNPFSDLGFTYNETLFSDTTTYDNPFDFDPNSVDGSLKTDTDYGFGVVGDEEVSKFSINNYEGFTGKVLVNTTGARFINISNSIVEDSNYPDDTVGFALLASQPRTSTSNTEIKINTSDHATASKLPILWTQFFDELPSVTDFTCAPNESNSSNIDFTWSVDGDDAWYGFLIIDSNNINSQYHDAVLHFPLNEAGQHRTTATEPKNLGSTSQVAISGALYDGEGLVGNALYFDGGDDYVRFGTSGSTDPTVDCTTEMSVVAHIIPDSMETPDTRYIVSQLVSGGQKFAIYLNSTNQVAADVYWTDSLKVTLVGSSIIPTDGETPTNIILTVDTKAREGNVKLFINGKLEDLSGRALATGTVNNWDITAGVGTPLNTDASTASQFVHIGAEANSFLGKIEEVVIYNKLIYPVIPKDGKYTLTRPLTEITATEYSSSKSYSARLFVKDYHNIRGKLPNEVASTSSISFRKAAFVLDTS